MNSNKLYNLLLKGWFGIKGRSGRQEYILRFLMMWIFGYSSVYFFNVFQNQEYSLLGGVSGIIAAFILTPLFILSIIQVFFVTHRRLHDLNHSGWWQLITFIPFGQLLMIGFIFYKGTVGANRFGEEPKY